MPHDVVFLVSAHILRLESSFDGMYTVRIVDNTFVALGTSKFDPPTCEFYHACMPSFAC